LTATPRVPPRRAELGRRLATIVLEDVRLEQHLAPGGGHRRCHGGDASAPRE
jgi:hypothetical protein